MKRTIVLTGIALMIVSYYMVKFNNETYKGEVAYALVQKYIPEKKETVDMNGKKLEVLVMTIILRLLKKMGQNKKCITNVVEIIFLRLYLVLM